MELTSILNENLINVNVQASNKEEVIRMLAHNFLENNYISNVEEFVQDVYKREKEGVTGLGNLIALPHGRSASVDEVGAAIAILDQEIEWESLDDQGAKIIILFAVGINNEGADPHLKLLASFARKLADEQVVKDLLNTNSVDEVINTLNQ